MIDEFTKRYADKSWICSSCNTKIEFELINDVECDWGIHNLIQCPNCGELFSIDKPCFAFQNITELAKANEHLIDERELLQYLSKGHVNCKN